MSAYLDYRQAWLEELDKLHRRHELAGQVGPDYYEPGMMEYLDKSDGLLESDGNTFTLYVEARGTRYDGRTEQIERVHEGEIIYVLRDRENPYNHNNFTLESRRHANVGNLPAELCNAMAPLYDRGWLRVDSASVSYAEPLSRRSRHAKQAVLFVCIRGTLLPPGEDSEEEHR